MYVLVSLKHKGHLGKQQNIGKYFLTHNYIVILGMQNKSRPSDILWRKKNKP